MSTEDTILTREGGDKPKLVRFLPRLRGRERQVRRLTLLDTLSDWANRSTGNQELRAAARAHWGQFVVGSRVDDLVYMKRVSRRAGGRDVFSDEIWSVRTLFQPQHRFFGAFAGPNWLLLFNMQSRDFLGAQDARWHAEMDRALRIWETLLPGVKRWQGTRFAHYVTFNSEHRDGRWTET